MSPENSNSAVAGETRVDLASLFCMIGRHGPAVVLALIATVCLLLVGITVYRTVRWKRRKATTTTTDTDTSTDTTTTTTADTAGDRDNRSPGAQRDEIRPRHEPSPEESRSSSSVESTDVSDGVQSGVKEEGDRKVRHRRAAAAAAAAADEKKHRPHYSHSPASDVQTTGSKHTTSGHRSEVSHNPRCGNNGAFTVAESEAEGAGDCARVDSVQDVKEVKEEFDGHENCCKEPELINDESQEEEEEEEEEQEKVFEAEDQKDENVTGDEKTKEEKEYFQCASNSQVYFNPAPCMNDNVVHERLQDNKVAPEINGLESNFEDHPDNLDHSECSSNHFSPEEERREVQQGVPQQNETCPSRSEMNNGHGQVCEVTGKDSDEDQVLTSSDTRPPQSDKHQHHMEQKDEHSLMGKQDEGVVFTEADWVKEKRPTGDVEHSPGHLNEPVKVDNHEEQLSVVKAQISGVEDLPDLSVDFQPPQSRNKDGELATSLDKEADFTLPDSYLPSIVKQFKCEKNETAAEEIPELHVSPSYKHQTSGQMVNGETLGKTTAPDTCPEKVNVPTGEGTSCSHFPSDCQEQKNDLKEITETFNEPQTPVTHVGVCDKVIIAAPVMSEEKHDADVLTLSQDQESDQRQTNERPSVVAQDLNPPLSQIKFQSFEQSELRANVKDNVPSPGVGQESGISSMTVSPDLQDSGNEFGQIVGDMEDCDPKSEETTNVQNSLFADDVVLSVFNKETTDIMFRHTDWTSYDSIAANEDMFGHEIEDSYHSALEQFMAKFAANGRDMKGTFEVVEIKEKKEVVRITKKAETGAENDTEELHEKTEISIMEATMDSNEWLMDSNYQFLPWMSPYVPPFAQDHTKISQLPTEDAGDAVCKKTDTEASTEVRKPSSLANADENAENYKKVVAVQPMPQNVYVTFRIHYVTHSPYQMVAITGNQQELGNWKEYIPMERAKDGHWTTVVSLPAESHMEWKFVIVDKGQVCRWEECGNRLLDTGCGDELTVHKLWGIL